MIEQVINSPVVKQLFITFIYQFFFVFGIIGFAVGVGLIFNHVRMHQFFRFMNQWVSVRRSTRWLAIPRNTEAVEYRFRYPIGTVVVLVAAFSTFVLIAKIDVIRVATAIPLNIPYFIEVWMIESVRWILIAGDILAITVGAMLILFPNTLRAIEARANHWYSTRSVGRSGDTMRMGFDRWFENYPRTMGLIVASGALVVVVDFGILLLQHT